jgi:hypothetical protein
MEMDLAQHPKGMETFMNYFFKIARKHFEVNWGTNFIAGQVGLDAYTCGWRYYV